MATQIVGKRGTLEALQRPLCVRGEKGVVLAVTLLIMLLLTALGGALLTLSAAEIVQGRISQNRLQALNLAEAGEAYARRALSLGSADLTTQDLDGVNGVDQTWIFSTPPDLTHQVNWTSNAVLAALQPVQPGEPKPPTGDVKIAPHATDPDAAVITSTAKLGYATKTIEVIARRTPLIPPGVKGAVTSNGPTATNGSITIDGRDHTLDGKLILNSGVPGIFTLSTFAQGGSSKIGGTNDGVDFAPANPANSSVINQNQPAGSTYLTPDAVLGKAEGWLMTQVTGDFMGMGGQTCDPHPVSGRLWCHGPNGQWVTNPADLTMPLNQVGKYAYVELPAGPSPANVWDNANLGDSTATLIVHNTAGNAVLKNTTSSGSSCGCFRGLVIADDVVHIHSTITGAVVSLTTGPSEGNVLGNGNGKVLFSKKALQDAVGSDGKIWPIYSWREVK